MLSKTAALALALSVIAAPAFADCAGHKKISADQSATTTQPDGPVIRPKASS
ncbi:hypothetical protein [Paracoccus sp. (in: a-proteobacteria)]|uniref:hypothetical protein n=1 Tax=Paracoccus sp. TaxID=267 RepID=UPI00321FFB8D